MPIDPTQPYDDDNIFAKILRVYLAYRKHNQPERESATATDVQAKRDSRALRISPAPFQMSSVAA